MAAACARIGSARKAIYNRLRHAIACIERVHPALGLHLVRSVKTGTHCVYDPEHHETWRVGHREV